MFEKSWKKGQGKKETKKSVLVFFYLNAIQTKKKHMRLQRRQAFN